MHKNNVYTYYSSFLYIGVPMSGVKSDIEIARAAKMKQIVECFGKNRRIPDQCQKLHLVPMGRHIAKLNLRIY